MKRFTAFGTFALVVGLSNSAFAQPFGEPGPLRPTPSGPSNASVQGSAPDPRAYGTTSYTELGYASVGFTPLGDGQWSHFASINGYSYRSGGTNTSTCTNIHFPSGASVVGMTTWTNDVDATAGHDVAYYVIQENLVLRIATIVLSSSTTGAPGEETLFHSFTPGPLVINNNESAYSVCVAHGVLGPGNENAGASFYYLLHVSAGPAVATFADVPVGTPQFRFVEALVAAGITAGCGGGNYCPGAPVTRGQMAVFLASALGLHFPN